MPNKVSDVVRKAIVDRLIYIGQVPGGCTYRAFFGRVYPNAANIQRNGTSLLNEIGRHCDVFPNDWEDDETKFEVVDYLSWTDQEFLYFCCEYVNPVFSRYQWDKEKEERVSLQPDCVEAINFYLTDCGFELREKHRVGDKIEYELVELTGVKGKVSSIVFAAIQKPDILLTDVLNKDIQIPVDESKYLLYDEEIGVDGLTWDRLQEWYDGNHSQGENSLIDGLEEAVKHCGSRPEELFFDAYLEIVEAYENRIPALLPQVYLYYDSKVQKERTERIFDHQCMDFLMLFSESQRVVIELDGVQHYSEGTVQFESEQYRRSLASPSKYASMVSAQREMTLSGYEVYRFGGYEFRDQEKAKLMLKEFFADLFAKHGFCF